jgi:hypothetical protein
MKHPYSPAIPVVWFIEVAREKVQVAVNIAGELNEGCVIVWHEAAPCHLFSHRKSSSFVGEDAAFLYSSPFK